MEILALCISAFLTYWKTYLHDGVLHLQVVAVPEGRASANGEIAVLDGKAVYVPERIVAFKTAVGCYDVAALFYAGLSFQDGYVVQMQVVRGEQRSLSSEFLVFYKLHGGMCFINFHAAKIHRLICPTVYAWRRNLPYLQFLRKEFYIFAQFYNPIKI